MLKLLSQQLFMIHPIYASQTIIFKMWPYRHILRIKVHNVVLPRRGSWEKKLGRPLWPRSMGFWPSKVGLTRKAGNGHGFVQLMPFLFPLQRLLPGSLPNAFLSRASWDFAKWPWRPRRSCLKKTQHNDLLFRIWQLFS